MKIIKQFIIQILNDVLWLVPQRYKLTIFSGFILNSFLHLNYFGIFQTNLQYKIIRELL